MPCLPLGNCRPPRRIRAGSRSAVLSCLVFMSPPCRLEASHWLGLGLEVTRPRNGRSTREKCCASRAVCRASRALQRAVAPTRRDSRLAPYVSHTPHASTPASLQAPCSSQSHVRSSESRLAPPSNFGVGTCRGLAHLRPNSGTLSRSLEGRDTRRKCGAHQCADSNECSVPCDKKKRLVFGATDRLPFASCPV